MARVFCLFLCFVAVVASSLQHRSHFRSRLSSDEPSCRERVPEVGNSTTPLEKSEGEMASLAALTPNRIKAGIAGGDAYPFMKDYIGWWYDWCV